MGELFGAAAGGAIGILVLAIAIEVALVALGIWIVYTVIWRAVRRGLREYHEPQIRAFNASTRQPRGPRDW